MKKQRSNISSLKLTLYLGGFFGIVGCMSSPLAKPTLAPKTMYHLEQATILSPDENGWSLLKSDSENLILARNVNDSDRTAVLSAAMYPVGLKKNAKEFFDFIIAQRSLNDDKERFRNLSSENEVVSFKGLRCLKYKTLSEDHGVRGSSRLKYFKTEGFVCRYPFSYIGFQFEISHRSEEKLIPQDLLMTAHQFFEGIQFVEPTVQKLQKIP